MKFLKFVLTLVFDAIIILSCNNDGKIISFQTDDGGNFSLFVKEDTVWRETDSKSTLQREFDALVVIDENIVYATISNNALIKYNIDSDSVEKRIELYELHNYRLALYLLQLELHNNILVLFGTNGVTVMDRDLNVLMAPCDSIMKRNPRLRRTTREAKYQFLNDTTIRIILPQNNNNGDYSGKDHIEDFTIHSPPLTPNRPNM